MSDDEMVAIVDEHNRPIDCVPRREMRARRLIHRATYIFVYSTSGELYVQERTATKDMFPGYYDLAAGGVVQCEESYSLSAVREAREELGITAVPLREHFDFFYEDARNRIWGRVFSCVYDGPFVLQAEEVRSGRFMPVHQASEGSLRPVTPDTAHALAELRRRQGG